jgi:hypothetical protein
MRSEAATPVNKKKKSKNKAFNFKENSSRNNAATRTKSSMSAGVQTEGRQTPVAAVNLYAAELKQR